MDNYTRNSIMERAVMARMCRVRFGDVSFWGMPTGSSIYGTDGAPGDLDFLVFNRSDREQATIYLQLIDDGWERGGSMHDQNLGFLGEFISVRKGIVNLILTCNVNFAFRWILAHDYLVRNFHGFKNARIAVFDHFRSVLLKARDVEYLLSEEDKIENYFTFKTDLF